jgi:hypothetical protein
MNEKIKKQWLKIIMYEDMPIIGLIYIIVLLKKKATNNTVKEYLKIKLQIKILKLILSIIAIVVLYFISINMLDSLLVKLQ